MKTIAIIPLNKKHLKYLAVKRKIGISTFLTHLRSKFNSKYKNYDIKRGYARYSPKTVYVFGKKGRGAFPIFYVSATRYDHVKELHEELGLSTIRTRSSNVKLADRAKEIKDSLDHDLIMVPKVEKKKADFIKVKIR